MAWGKAGGACTTKASGIWNDKGSDPLMAGARCCPTKDWQNFNARGFCTRLPDESECVHDWQCQSNNCYPAGTADSVCKAKRPSNTVAPWWRGHICVSGKAALWNDRVSNPDTRCCPTDAVGNNWAKGWCLNLPTGSACIYNDQCSSKKCNPEMSPDGKCK
jgi:hypothetical protein